MRLPFVARLCNIRFKPFTLECIRNKRQEYVGKELGLFNRLVNELITGNHKLVP